MIYVECKPDFALIQSISRIPKKDIIHAGSKSEVCKQIQKQSNSKGLIDEDPLSHQPSYIWQLELDDNYSNFKIKILNDTSKNNTLFVLSPKLEDWIIRASEVARIDIQQYGLPNTPKRLHEVINFNLDKFGRLLSDLKNRSDWIKTLRRLVHD